MAAGADDFGAVFRRAGGMHLNANGRRIAGRFRK
jgi:hypothetical protein